MKEWTNEGGIREIGMVNQLEETLTDFIRRSRVTEVAGIFAFVDNTQTMALSFEFLSQRF